MNPDSLAVLIALLFLDGATLAVFTTPLLLQYGKFHDPWVVALAGGLANSLGSAVQMLLFRWALDPRHTWLSRFAPSRDKLDAALQRYSSASFVAITVARATPLPDAPLKLVIAATRYPLWKYTVAVLLGAIPYFYVLARVGHAVKIPTGWLIAAGVLIVVGVVVDRLRRRRP